MTDGSAAFRRALAGLDREAFVRFVAAVHAAREAVEAVERDGGVLVVRGPEPRRILPVAARRGPFRGPAPVGAVRDPVDEVVAQVDDGAARGTATRRGARYRSPDDLYARVRYGVAPDAGRGLLDEHLGIDPEATADDPGRVRRRRAVAAVGVLVATVGVLVAAVLAGGVGSVGSPADAPAGTGAAEPAATATPPAAAPSDPYPPGVDGGGVTDETALARAHADAVADRRYQLTVVAGRTGTTWAGTRVRAVGPRSIVRSITDRPANGTGGVSFRSHSGGNYTYVGITGPNGTQYVRETVKVRDGEGERHADRTAGYVARYLSGAGGEVTRVDGAGTTAHRLRVTRPPPRLADVASNYTATAVVTDRGFVLSLEVEYLRETDDGTRAVAFRFGYEPYRHDGRPPWYEALRASTNGTRTTPADGGA